MTKAVHFHQKPFISIKSLKNSQKRGCIFYTSLAIRADWRNYEFCL